MISKLGKLELVVLDQLVLDTPALFWHNCLACSHCKFHGGGSVEWEVAVLLRG